MSCDICNCCPSDGCKTCANVITDIASSPWDIAIDLTNADRFCPSDAHPCEREQSIGTFTIPIKPCIGVPIPGAVNPCDDKFNALYNGVKQKIKIKVTNDTYAYWVLEFYGKFNFQEGFDGSKCHFHCRVIGNSCTNPNNDPMVSVPWADVNNEKFLGGLYVTSGGPSILTTYGEIIVCIQGCPDNCCFAEGTLEITKVVLRCSDYPGAIPITDYAVECPDADSKFSNLSRRCCLCCCDDGADWDSLDVVCDCSPYAQCCKKKLHQSISGSDCSYIGRAWYLEDFGTCGGGTVPCEGPDDCPKPDTSSCASMYTRTTQNYGSMCPDEECDGTLTLDVGNSYYCPCACIGESFCAGGSFTPPDPCFDYGFAGYYALICVYYNLSIHCPDTIWPGHDDTHCP